MYPFLLFIAISLPTKDENSQNWSYSQGLANAANSLDIFLSVIYLTKFFTGTSLAFMFSSPSPQRKEIYKVGQKLDISFQGTVGGMNFSKGLLNIQCPNYQETIFKGYMTKLFEVPLFSLGRNFVPSVPIELKLNRKMKGDCTLIMTTDSLSPTSKKYSWNRVSQSARFTVIE
eukprot:NODE_289_length_10645_cov_0.615115.p7 type:complete len:173 gc:universal NODE_289_length_10645_cov_0.615115:3834-4352(+)